MDRIFLYFANALALLCGLIAVVLLGLGVIDLSNGIAKAEIWMAIIALAVVPYCLTGTLHRIVNITGKA